MPSYYIIVSQANIYLFKVNNRNTRKGCETCSKLTIKTPERHRFPVFGVNTERYGIFLQNSQENLQVSLKGLHHGRFSGKFPKIFGLAIFFETLIQIFYKLCCIINWST